MRFLIALLINGLIVYGASAIFSGIQVENYSTALLMVLVLTLVNFLIRPILVFLTLPITIITFGLFLIIINAAMILLTDNLLRGFYVDGWVWAALLAIILGVMNSGINYQTTAPRHA